MSPADQPAPAAMHRALRRQCIADRRCQSQRCRDAVCAVRRLSHQYPTIYFWAKETVSQFGASGGRSDDRSEALPQAKPTGRDRPAPPPGRQAGPMNRVRPLTLGPGIFKWNMLHFPAGNLKQAWAVHHSPLRVDRTGLDVALAFVPS